jgi:hypothetical protein
MAKPSIGQRPFDIESAAEVFLIGGSLAKEQLDQREVMNGPLREPEERE